MLLAPLISMVTMAVGQNVAAAFTLVGTLAIVRFRTAVRDTRDTVFVIFSVAVGMAMGTFNVDVALIGTLIVGCVIAVMRFADRRKGPTRQPPQLLRLVISPPDPDASIYETALATFGTRATVVASEVDRRGQRLVLRLSLQGLDQDRSPDLLASLLEVPEILAASCRLEDV